MLKKINKKVFTIIIILLIFCVSVLSKYTNQNNSVQLEKVSLKSDSTINKNNFAIMIQKEDGSGYETSNNFPTGYFFNEELSGCIDYDGKAVVGALTFNQSTNSVLVSTNGSIYCYLYFDRQPAVDFSLSVSTNGTSNTVPSNGIYNQTLTCNKGNSIYNKYYQRIEIGGFTPGTSCTLKYTSDTTSYPLLSSVVQEANPTNNNGYRYSGKNPNNYIWFNNELWRIIGLIPACTSTTSSTCSTRTNLVKIIRNESIGGLAYDAKASGYTGKWGSNTLYALLNSYYYGKQDGTGTSYCYGYKATSVVDCDYTNIGISTDPNDYYNKMIKNVYWNIGASTNSAKPSAIYSSESGTVMTATSKIGLMSASDFGYAAVVSGYGTNVTSYNTTAITSTNWLYGKEFEWTNIQYSGYSDSALSVGFYGYVGYQSQSSSYGGIYVYGGCAVRPVVYLDSGVYKISGTGTYTDPYMVGI